MDAFDALKRFFKAGTDVTIALPSDPFIVLDRDRAAVKLKIAERAQANGVANFPPADSENLDDVETEIVAEIGEHSARAQIDAAAMHRVYGQRLSELALLRELSTITGAGEQALGDFRATIINRQGRLGLAKDAIRESYNELAHFKREHGLDRPAHRSMNKLYAWSIVGISWIIESAGNTAFLMVNDDYGLLGGFATAVVVAAINIILSALVGQYWWPYLFYRKSAQRLLAASGSILWFLAVIVWNLLVGHFRDAKILGLANPEQAALGLFLNRPFQLDSIYSYGLLVLGIVFAVLAATAAFKKDDPYPGYGAIYRRHEDRCDEYADQIEEALDELRETRDDAIETANAIRSELGAQFRERGQIISSRDTHRNRYREHQDYLETIGNALLGQYRAANVRSRTDKLSPSHFNKPWVLKRTDLPFDTAEPSIDNEVLRAQEVLEHSIKTISQAYQEAIESFEHLEKIKGSLTNG